MRRLVPLLCVAVCTVVAGCSEESIPTAAQQSSDDVLYAVISSDHLGTEGCTPGYWKNHLDAWAATWYSPDQDFDTVFGVDYFDPDITLYEAVWLGGGGVNKLARHGTAALLSRVHPGVVYYGYYHQAIIDIVREWGSGVDNSDLLVAANEAGCPLD